MSTQQVHNMQSAAWLCTTHACPLTGFGMFTNTPISALLPTYAPYPFPLVRGEGDRVYDDSGQAWWDFYGGHCVCATGHSHPTVVKAVSEQAASLLFYSAAAALPVRDQAAAE